MITPRELLDTSIGQLRILAVFLREQLGERDDGSKSDMSETRTCSEILGYLSILMMKVERDVRQQEPHGPPDATRG